MGRTSSAKETILGRHFLVIGYVCWSTGIITDEFGK